MQKPSVSVVMSVRNGERFLANCIESILGQTLSDFEFIIVNDHSEDETGEILKNYAARDHRIKIIQDTAHRTLSQSLNEAIAASSGEWVARMDADDISLPTRLQKEKEFLESHPETGLVGTGFSIMDERGETIKQIKQELDETQIRKRLIRGNILCHSSVMLKRTALEKAGYYTSHLASAEDYDLYLKILKYFQISLIPEILHLWRAHSNNASKLKSSEQAGTVLRIQATAIRKELYPVWNFVYLVRPFLSIFFVSPIKRCLR